jgi:hypothetical protein
MLCVPSATSWAATRGDTAAVEEARTRVRESIEQMNRAGTAFVAFASEVLERDDQWDLTNTRGR